MPLFRTLGGHRTHLSRISQSLLVQRQSDLSAVALAVRTTQAQHYGAPELHSVISIASPCLCSDLGGSKQ